jgi:tetratricopeptide (TPR) repeat protein
MPSGPGERYDFFLSRRGSVAAIAQEVTDLLTEKGYRVFVQDYDIHFGDSLIENMHEAVSNSRDLVILFTHDYLQSPYTRKEFTSFEAQRLRSLEKRHIVVLRCDDAPMVGLLSDNVYQDLGGIDDPEERKRRIIAAAERQSQAAPPPPRPFIGMPPRIASFTGRADELDHLDAILMQDKPAAVTQASVGRAAVQGMGGVGKTSLAIEYAHRFRGLYAGVCWCPAETRTGFLSALANLAVTLGAATAEEADVEKAAKSALRRLAEQRATWLLVYDNVPAPDHIADLLPSAGARVLITSRFSDWSELADEVPLDVLPLEEAVALLRSRTGRGYAGAQTLAEALGCLPLALDHAAAYCKRTQMRFADYATKASSLIDAAPRGVGYLRSVAATFDLAITEAVAHCPAAEALMAYLAQCAPERIPMILVEGAVEGEVERMEALAALAEVSLVKHDPFEDGTPAVMVHRLVQAVARARSKANGLKLDAIGRLITRLVAIYPEEGFDQPSLWPLCAKLTPHVLAPGEGYPDTPKIAEWGLLVAHAAGYLHRRAAFSQAAHLYRDAIARCEKALGPEHIVTGTNLGGLALVLSDQGDYSGARPLFERSLAISEKALSPMHPNTAMGLNNFAILLSRQGDFAGARALYERALAIWEKELGPEHRSTALSLGSLGLTLHDQGDYAAARPVLERALAIWEKTVGPEHPETATCLNNLGLVLHSQGDLAGARPLYERVLAIREKAFGPEHPETAITLNNLAGLLNDNGDLGGARTYFARALAILEKALGPEHPYVNRTRYNLSVLLINSGLPTEALALSQTALAAHDKLLGRDHSWTKDSARVTADALDALGRTEEAKALRERYGVTGPERNQRWLLKGDKEDESQETEHTADQGSSRPWGDRVLHTGWPPPDSY